MKTLTLGQIATIRASLFTISFLSEDSVRSGASKQHRRNCADTIGRHVLIILDITNNLPDAEPAPVKKPRAPRKPKTTTDTPAPEPMLALEG